MKVREIMTSPAITVGADAPFSEVVDTLLAHDISGLPVVDGDGHLVGIVTEADLVSKEAYGFRRRRALGLVVDYLRGRDPQWVRKAAGRTAGDVMTADPVAIAPDDDLAVAARYMLEARRKRLPVLEDGRVVGIVTRHDLLQRFHRPDSDLAADVQRLLADPLRIPESHRLAATVDDGVVTLTGTVQWPGDVALVEAVVARLDGVVAVDSDVAAREPEPRLATVPRQW